MIIRIAQIATGLLLKKKLISHDERDVYRYSFELLISTVMNMAIVLILGLLFHRLYETLVFLATFCTIKRFTGGLHMPSYGSCIIFFGCIYFLLLLTDRFFNIPVNGFFIACTALSALPVLLLAPVIHPNKLLAPDEIIRLKKKVRWLVALFSLLFSIAFIFFKSKMIARYMGYSMLLISFLVISGELINKMDMISRQRAQTGVEDD